MSASSTQENEADKEARWNSTVEEMISVLEHVLSKPEIKEKPPAELATICTLELCDVVGGVVVYIPRGKKIKIKLRNDEIFKAWTNGEDVRSIAKRHRMAIQTIYDIIARNRKNSEKKN